ncbi:hypothetical protein METBIDRAFT_31801 [Metschnikowia bicuspidata var. bicuspidata NRRL YB-4993]|uniref:Uncharacterized protein n=1 Tax=Metschnikowia bicuspidata var. bicuspidata NRRL YB-4993 TaxID=869754 RepID=A0A1A0HBH4_9ASCO|nr:hypothetical protein METBIDRAFT_31801 [Metschnikowia bicuspidata var. bicuspidata NRRL YB-4993]OBA21227.1 hypothetical protein METBIDRAFT_31801 [Metschnikowia bicuspidata var. bicuspidata NRRL YB-4993]
MATTERSFSNSPEDLSDDSLISSKLKEQYLPGIVPLTEGSSIQVPVHSMIRASHSGHEEIKDTFDGPSCNHQNASVSDSLSPSRAEASSIPSTSGEMINTSPLNLTCVKSKRSSSTSNDLSHERDRFRARFESFNTPKWATIEDQDANVESGCQECEDISTKTKKLNIKHPTECCLAKSAMKLTIKYSSDNKTSPLDRKSTQFRKYKQCPGSQATQILDLRFITPEQLSVALSWYFNTPLPPTDHMFPWLHGLHPENFAQRSFFGSQTESSVNLISSKVHGESRKPDLARFIMCVDTTGHSTEARVKTLRNTVAVDEILQRIEVARSEARCLVKDLIDRLFLANDYFNLDVSSFTEAIILDCLETGFMPNFVDSDPRRGISLRNFQIQVNKAAACADFIVYCYKLTHEKNSCKCMSFARLLKVAQIVEDMKQPFKYDVFVFGQHKINLAGFPEIWSLRDNSNVLAGTDVRKKTQLHFPGLEKLKLEIFDSWDADFQVKEKLETTVMSAASKLHLNVWLGNLWDHQVMMLFLKGEPESYSEECLQIIPLDESKDNYCDSRLSLLTRCSTMPPDSNIISLLPPPRSHWQLFVHCHNDALFPSQSLLNDLLFKYTISSRKASEVSEIYQLDFPSSGSIGFGDCRQENLISIVNTCKLLYLYSSSVSEDSIASLIYCSDGYTELTLLIFCFLMYAEDIPLETAMLKLHLEYGRPYYAFNSDVQVLRKLETILRKYSPKKLSDNIIWSQGETISQNEINEIFLKTKQRSTQDQNSIPRKFRLGYIASDSSSDTDDSDSECESEETERTSVLERSWVEDLEGSLPSRILPYIYLGSLKHANNLTILSKLDITKIISVGEPLEWLSKPGFQSDHDVEVESVGDGKVEIFHIRRKRLRHQTLEPQCNVTSVIKLNNLLDDGIDDLSRSLPQVLEYIDQEYKQSEGSTKFLIHCRVGVSRSATVVIAEVMRRLKLNLPQAYLYVRVRRLNIVIQPNLRFMYELFKWEEKERERSVISHQEYIQSPNYDLRVTDWFVMCREINRLNMPFILP